VLCLGLSACATTTDRPTQGQRAWGAQATLLPSWQRLGQAAAAAARDPNTWLPAAGAVLFSATAWDKDVSDWAQEQHPVFGSQRAALNASDDLRDTAKYGVIATALLTPNAPDAGAAVGGKLKGLGLQWGAYALTESTTKLLKREVARRRPNQGNNRSFPSGHASAAFAAGTLARRNVAASSYHAALSQTLDVGFVALGAGTGWARVEAGVHYPSDVLAGAALGHFIAAVVNDAFIGEGQSRVPQLSLQLQRGMIGAGLAWPLY
jgi:membrane-associated phospholipid phosphatase